MAKNSHRALVVCVTVAVPPVVGAGVSEAVSPTKWPTSISAHEWNGTTGVKGPFAMGSLASPSVLKAGGGVQSPTYLRNTGWAIATLDHYQYPIVSSNHGISWRIGGIYFAMPDSRAFDFVGAVKVFSPRIVAEYAKGSTTIDITNDGGHHWFQTFLPALIRTISSYGPPAKIAPEGTIEMEVQSEPGSPVRTGYYASIDGGKIWNLTGANR